MELPMDVGAFVKRVEAFCFCPKCGKRSKKNGVEILTGERRAAALVEIAARFGSVS
jgi:hypothetical protein